MYAASMFRSGVHVCSEHAQEDTHPYLDPHTWIPIPGSPYLVEHAQEDGGVVYEVDHEPLRLLEGVEGG